MVLEAAKFAYANKTKEFILSQKLGSRDFWGIANSVLNKVNPLSAKFIKWSNTLKQIVGKLPTICLSVFDHFSGLALKGLNLLYHLYSTAQMCSVLHLVKQNCSLKLF